MYRGQGRKDVFLDPHLGTGVDFLEGSPDPKIFGFLLFKMGILARSKWKQTVHYSLLTKCNKILQGSAATQTVLDGQLTTCICPPVANFF